MISSGHSETATGSSSGRARFLSLLLFVALVGGCGPPRERFEGTHPSPEALTETCLQALEARDRERLEGLALTEREFHLEVFPEMPAYGNIPPDLAWSQLAARSLYGLASVLQSHGGRSWHLEEIVFRGGTTVYQTFAVHREPMLHLSDPHTGERRVIALFGSLLEQGGRYKLFSYNIDR